MLKDFKHTHISENISGFSIAELFLAEKYWDKKLRRKHGDLDEIIHALNCISIEKLERASDDHYLFS